MPIDKEKQELIEEVNDEEFEEYDERDFGFIISPEGDLKSIMFPENLMEDPPKEIKKILKIFGIKDLHDITPKSLH